MDRSGQTVWSWDVFDHLVPPAGIDGDWTHGNTHFVDLAGGFSYYSARNLNAVFKIDRTTGHIVWRLGEGGDFLPDPTAVEPWFVHQHAPEVSASNRVLLYDNGTPMRGYSRVVEYQVDEESKQAKLIWQYPTPSNPDLWFADVMGNATRLPNRNVLICVSNTQNGEIGRFKEVTDQGQKIAEMIFHVAAIGSIQTPIYRVYRIPALVETLARP